ncbi:ribosomal protein S18-alanine N-acetyltransferase [candidate division KSB1 bacterium]|nr:ribosomal protein S18-alanine N-acetyltransferase [candidate division KSB1 bacterium]
MERPFQSTDFDVQNWREQIKSGVTFTLLNGQQLIVRSIQQHDIGPAYLIEKASFKDAWPKIAFQLEVDDPQYRISLVGYIGDRLVTYILCYHIIDEMHINNIAVANEFRQQGIASTIFWLLTEIGNYCGVHVSHLEVRRSNLAAIALYEKCGYRVVGSRKKYYESDNEDALTMSRYHT